MSHPNKKPSPKPIKTSDKMTANGLHFFVNGKIIGQLHIGDIENASPYDTHKNQKASVESGEENAKLMAKCWNEHDELVEALKMTNALNLHLYEEGTVGNRVYVKIQEVLNRNKHSDNTIIIHPSKTYTREEVIAFIKNFHKESRIYVETDTPFIKEGFMTKWIEDNL